MVVEKVNEVFQPFMWHSLHKMNLLWLLQCGTWGNCDGHAFNSVTSFYFILFQVVTMYTYQKDCNLQILLFKTMKQNYYMYVFIR